jgi:hypothetical protein
MSGTRVCLTGLLVTLLGLSALRGQEPAADANAPIATAPQLTDGVAEPPPPTAPLPTTTPREVIAEQGPIPAGAAPLMLPPGQSGMPAAGQILTEEKVPASVTVPPGDVPGISTMPAEANALGAPSGGVSREAPEPGTIPEQQPINPLPPPDLLPLNNWLAYRTTPGCCCFQGRNGPIRGELFLRNGLAFVTGSGIFGAVLKTGWDIDGGGRVLFFNPQESKAWVVTVGLSNIVNHAPDATHPFTLRNVQVRTGVTNPITGLATPEVVTVPSVTTTTSGFNQTFVNLAGGREYYLLGSANPSQNCLMWRVGWDFGGRYGTSSVFLRALRHGTDTIGGMFGALHSDVEYPFHCAILQAGIRVEYNYIWNDALQAQNPSDYQSINLLFSGGMRF